MMLRGVLVVALSCGWLHFTHSLNIGPVELAGYTWVPALPISMTGGLEESHAMACTRVGAAASAGRIRLAWNRTTASTLLAAWHVAQPANVSCCTPTMWCSWHAGSLAACEIDAVSSPFYENRGWVAGRSGAPVFTCVPNSSAARALAQPGLPSRARRASVHARLRAGASRISPGTHPRAWPVTAAASASRAAATAPARQLGSGGGSAVVHQTIPSIVSVSPTSLALGARLRVDAANITASEQEVRIAVGGATCADPVACHGFCKTCSSEQDCEPGMACLGFDSTGGKCVRPCEYPNRPCSCGGQCVTLWLGGSSHLNTCLNPGAFQSTAPCASSFKWGPDAPATARYECQTTNMPAPGHALGVSTLAGMVVSNLRGTCAAAGEVPVVLSAGGVASSGEYSAAQQAYKGLVPKVRFTSTSCTADTDCITADACSVGQCVQGCCAYSPVNGTARAGMSSSSGSLDPLLAGAGTACTSSSRHLMLGQQPSTASYLVAASNSGVAHSAPSPAIGALTTDITLDASNQDDAPLSRIDVAGAGWNLALGGEAYSSVYASPNGYLTVQANAQCFGVFHSYYLDAMCDLATAYAPAIAPIIADWDPSASVRSKVQARLDARGLCVTWSNMQLWAAAAGYSPVSTHAFFNFTACARSDGSVSLYYPGAAFGSEPVQAPTDFWLAGVRSFGATSAARTGGLAIPIDEVSNSMRGALRENMPAQEDAQAGQSTDVPLALAQPNQVLLANSALKAQAAVHICSAGSAACVHQTCLDVAAGGRVSVQWQGLACGMDIQQLRGRFGFDQGLEYACEVAGVAYAGAWTPHNGTVGAWGMLQCDIPALHSVLQVPAAQAGALLGPDGLSMPLHLVARPRSAGTAGGYNLRAPVSVQVATLQGTRLQTVALSWKAGAQQCGCDGAGGQCSSCGMCRSAAAGPDTCVAPSATPAPSTSPSPSSTPVGTPSAMTSPSATPSVGSSPSRMPSPVATPSASPESGGWIPPVAGSATPALASPTSGSSGSSPNPTPSSMPGDHTCSTVRDCNGVCDGTAILDSCLACVGGNTGYSPDYLKDCDGVCNGPNHSCQDDDSASGDDDETGHDSGSKQVVTSDKQSGMSLTGWLTLSALGVSTIALAGLCIAYIRTSRSRAEAVGQFAAGAGRQRRGVLTEEQVLALPVKEAADLPGVNGESCVVCLDEMEGEARVMRLPCGHHFHEECVVRWLTQRTNTCPLCKQPALASSPSPEPDALPSTSRASSISNPLRLHGAERTSSTTSSAQSSARASQVVPLEIMQQPAQRAQV